MEFLKEIIQGYFEVCPTVTVFILILIMAIGGIFLVLRSMP